MLNQPVSYVAPFPSAPAANLRYIVKGDSLAGGPAQLAASDVATTLSWFFGVVTGQVAPSGFSSIGLTGANNTWTGANTFNGAVTLAAGRTLTVSATAIVSVAGTVFVAPSGAIEVGANGTLLIDTSGAASISGTVTYQLGGGSNYLSGSFISVGTVASPNATLDVYGTQTIQSGGSLLVANGGKLNVKVGSTFNIYTTDGHVIGKLNVDVGGIIHVSGAGGLEVGDGVAETASIVVKGGSEIELKSGATLLQDSGSTAGFNGTVNHNNLVNNTGASIASDAATTHNDSSTITRLGPTIMSGINAYVGERQRYTIADGGGTISPEQYEVAYLTNLLTADCALTLNNPPAGARTRIHVMVAENQLSTHALSVKDQSGATVIRFDGITSSHFGWADLRYDPGASTWIILDAGRVNLSGSPPTI